MIEHPEIAREYVDLKWHLKGKYEHNRDAYTDEKEEFVRRYSELAKTQYGERYKIDAI